MTVKTRILTLVGAGAVALAMSSPTFADAPRSVKLGDTVQGSLAATDGKADDNSLYDDYTIELAAGQNIQFIMRSEAFDSFLHVGRGVGAEFEPIKTDDDGGGGQDSRVRFRADEAGRYTVRANAFGEDMSGAYSLAVQDYTPPPSAVARPISAGETANGRLADGGSRIEDTDRLYDLYTLSGAEGDRFMITMRSTDFDSMLQLGKDGPDGPEILAEDDDGGGETNARIFTTLPETGEYAIHAISYDRETGGAYALSVERLPPPAPAPRVKTLRRGRIVSGEFSIASPMFDEFRPYDLYSIRGRAGETVTVTMQSEDFDAFLDAGAVSPVGFAVVTSDDDSGGETNAKLDITFEKSGVVVIRPSALGGGASGAYILSVVE